MRLLIDLGNTRVKWAWQAVPDGSLVDAQGANHDVGRCAQLLTAVAEHEPADIWLSSVAGAAADSLQSAIQAACSATTTRAISPAQLGGIRNAYSQPERLGVDRFLVLLAAARRYPAQALLVVDAGTALTIDALDAHGQHLGGSIAPGLGLMRHSLGRGTATLGASADPPRVTLDQLGADTEGAIECGILSAAHGAIALRLQQLRPRQPRLLFTGGDAVALARDFAHAEQFPLLVLEGLSHYADLMTAAGSAT